MTLTLAEANSIEANSIEANSIVDTAIAKAQLPRANVSVAVCDERGNFIVLNRVNEAYAEVNRFSIGKAVASAEAGLPSDEVEGNEIIRR